MSAPIGFDLDLTLGALEGAACNASSRFEAEALRALRDVLPALVRAREDSERIDWLESGVCDVIYMPECDEAPEHWELFGQKASPLTPEDVFAKSIREAIDAARSATGEQTDG